MRSRHALTAAVAVVALAGGSIAVAQAATGAGTVTASSRLQVVGYAEAGGTTGAQLSASAAALTTVGVDGINVTTDGAGLTAVSAESLALLTAAHTRHEKAELLVATSTAISATSRPRSATGCSARLRTSPPSSTDWLPRSRRTAGTE